MGVPKFFRYISERYPCLSELAREQSIPDFDNFYLDMNGIIHNCSHPDDNNIHFSITEEQMFKDIFNYIDKLFFLIKPKKLFFMAVDGVAPRAKMNQQRGRRFRSAKEAEVLEQKALRSGEIRQNERFDSNCITPGTEFMARLHEALKYFVKSKISTDSMWQTSRIILSGHDCPGEGEHKIMNYIRYMKSQKEYDRNTRHCIYGLDADLIILGLCTHELQFVVLREEVKFGRNNKRAPVEATRFFLLHLNLLREYMELEFDELRKTNSKFDIAKMIDDWVLMGFLVGNDFIPHLPCFHISSNALPLLYKTYIEAFPSLGGYINEGGKLNLDRLEKYFTALAAVELKLFQENYYDLKYLSAKISKNSIDEGFDFNIIDTSNSNAKNDLTQLMENTKLLLDSNSDYSLDESQYIAEEFEMHKRNYYMDKLHQNDMTSQQMQEQAFQYITALQWNLDYYYHGVQSWDWYYPHHYAPFISDLKDFKDYKIEFTLGAPFLPYEQLLAVLPAASKQLLPLAYQDLISNPNSEIIHFYPETFDTDLNGKKHEWESVVLIPFIDEKLLINAMKPCNVNLTPQEIERNKLGPMLQYDYTSTPQEEISGIYTMEAIKKVFCTEKEVSSHESAIFSCDVVYPELTNASRNVFFPGFPTMKHLNYDFEIKPLRVKVFDQSSRGDNLILKPQKRNEFDDVYKAAETFLGQTVYIGWPHLVKATVATVFNNNVVICKTGVKENDSKVFQLNVKSVQEHLLMRMGIELDDYNIMLQVHAYVGKTHLCGAMGKIVQNDVWSPLTTIYPVQCVVPEISVMQNATIGIQKIEDFFPIGTLTFYLGNKYHACAGEVVDPMIAYINGRICLRILSYKYPDFSKAIELHNGLKENYINSYNASSIIGISAKCLGRITGTVLVVAGVRRNDFPENAPKLNIGLQLKFPKQQEERAGYARCLRNQWHYSSKAIELVKKYFIEYPHVFEYLSLLSEKNGLIFESDIFPDNLGENCVEKVVAWIKSQEYIASDRIACGSEVAEKDSVEKVIEIINDIKNHPFKEIKAYVKPHLLIKPDVTLPLMYKSPKPIKLFDRVVTVKTTYMVPVGFRGTVIGIHPVTDPNPVRLEYVKIVENFYEILFDRKLTNGNDIYGLAPGHVSKVPESSLLLIIPDTSNVVGEVEQNLQPLDNKNKVALRGLQLNQNNDNSNTFNIGDISKNVCTNSIQKKRFLQKKCSKFFWTPIHSITPNSKEFWTPTETELVHEISKNSSTLKSNSDINSSVSLPENLSKTTLSNSTHTNRACTQKSTQQFKIMKKTVQQTSNIEVDYNSKTDALKLLLGIQKNTTFKNPEKSEKFKQLPQPPRSWKDSVNFNTSPMLSQIDFHSQHAESLNAGRGTFSNPEMFSHEPNTVTLTVNSPNISSKTEAIKPSKSEKPYRLPKIAAKFDNTYSSNI